MTRSLISISLLLFSLIAGSLTNDETKPRALPSVAGILEKILNKFETDGFDIPELNLGEGVGRFSNIRAEPSGKFEKVLKSVKTYGFDLKLSAEKITVKGFYDIENIDLPELFPIFGKGNFSVELEQLDLVIRTEVTPNLSTGKFTTKIKNFNASLEKSTLQFDNLMNDEDLGNFLNELLSSLIPDLLQMLQKQIVSILEPLIGNVMDIVIYCIKNAALSGKFEECIKNMTRIGYDLPQIPHFSPAILTSLN